MAAAADMAVARMVTAEAAVATEVADTTEVLAVDTAAVLAVASVAVEVIA